MKSEVSRRRAMKGLAIGAAGVPLLLSSSQPTLAAEGWTSTDPPEIESSDGTISRVYLPDAGFSFSVSWSGLDDDQLVDVTVSARLGKSGVNAGATEFETIGSGQVDLGSASGSADAASLSWTDPISYPLEIIASHPSIVADDFEASTDGTSETTPVDIRVEFTHTEVSESVTTTFDVTVTNTGTVVSDDFEDGGLTEYAEDSTYNAGSSTVVNTTTSFSGDHLAELNTNGSVYAIGSTGSLSEPSAGDTITYRVYFPNTDDNALYLYYGVQTDSSVNDTSYRITIRNVDDSVQLDNRNSGSTIASGATNNIPSGEWLRVELVWGTDGSHTLTLYDSSGTELGSVNGSDSELSSGGIGYGLNNRNGNNSTAYVDYVTYE